jgi:hypothetical protein
LRTSPRVWTGKAGLEEASSPKWQELMPLTSQSPAWRPPRVPQRA